MTNSKPSGQFLVFRIRNSKHISGVLKSYMVLKQPFWCHKVLCQCYSSVERLKTFCLHREVSYKCENFLV